MNSLTGITTVQIFLYFKLYPSDKIGLKIFVRVLRSVHQTRLTRYKGFCHMVFPRAQSSPSSVIHYFLRFLDLTHTVLIGRTVWHGLIVHFGAMDRAQALPW